MVKKKRTTQSEKVVKIPPHQHCIMCGKAIPEGEKFCSDECEMAFKRLQRQKILNMVYIFILILVLLIIVPKLF